MSDRSRKLFETLVRQNEAALMACLRTMIRDPGLADDLFQETLLTAWKRFDQFDQTLPLGPWLRGIAVNLARNAARKRQRDCLIFGESLQQQVDFAIDRLEQPIGLQKGDALASCLSRLPDRSRELIRRRYEQNQNAARIAELTESTASAVRKQLQRIRVALARCVAEKVAGTS